MRSRRLIGLLLSIALCCLLIIVAGGGLEFVRHPVGAIYVLLWVTWWLLIAFGRQRGVPSVYDRGRRVTLTLALGIV